MRAMDFLEYEMRAMDLFEYENGGPLGGDPFGSFISFCLSLGYTSHGMKAIKRD
jgi:hypothetical protein